MIKKSTLLPLTGVTLVLLVCTSFIITGYGFALLLVVLSFIGIFLALCYKKYLPYILITCIMVSTSIEIGGIELLVPGDIVFLISVIVLILYSFSTLQFPRPDMYSMIFIGILCLGLASFYWGDTFNLKGAIVWLQLYLLYYIVLTTSKGVDIEKLLLLILLFSSFDIIRNCLISVQGIIETGTIQRGVGDALNIGIGLCISIAYLVVKRNGINKMYLFVLIYTVILVSSLIFVGKRSVWLGILVVMIYIFIKNMKRVKTVTFFLVVLTISFLPYFLVPMVKKFVDARILTIFNSDYASTSERLLLIKGSIELILENPLQGVGWSNFNKNMNVVWPISENILGPHNAYLQIWVEMGILGLVMFLLLFMIPFFRLMHRKTDTFTHLSLTVLLIFISIILFFDDFAGERKLVFVTISGIVQAYCGYHSLNKHEERGLP